MTPLPSLLRMVLAASLVALPGCDLPQDQEQTEILVRERGAIRLGRVAGARPDPVGEAVLAAVSHDIGVGIETREGESERLLSDLEEGELDLVYGHFPQDSPWSRKVYFGQPLGWDSPPPPHTHVPRFVMRNGENRWIMRIERAARP